MCKCTPSIRTPFCGKLGCEWPASSNQLDLLLAGERFPANGLLKNWKGKKMAKHYINRSNDEEIIDIVRSVMDNGTGKAETVNEHILIKLMQLRGTPMTSFDCDQEKVDKLYDMWKNEGDG